MTPHPHLLPLEDADRLEDFALGQVIIIASAPLWGCSEHRKKLLYIVRRGVYQVRTELGEDSEPQEFMEIRDAITAYNDLG